MGQGARVSIYHLLGAAFGQGVAITQVVDLDVLDVVTVLLVDLDIESTTIGRSGRGSLCRARRGAGRGGLGRKVSCELLALASRACRTARMGGTSTCCGAFFWLSWALIRAAASAAAAAASLLGAVASTLLATGLRLRAAPAPSHRAGERERRSNLLRRGGSGSAWSKRERLRVSSPMSDDDAVGGWGDGAVVGESTASCESRLLLGVVVDVPRFPIPLFSVPGRACSPPPFPGFA